MKFKKFMNSQFTIFLFSVKLFYYFISFLLNILANAILYVYKIIKQP